MTYRVPAGAIAALPPASVPSVDFAETLRLRGYRLNRTSLAAGESLGLIITWELLQPTPAELRAFVHVLGPTRPDGSPLYAQHDSQPCDNAYPTWKWAAGELLTDRVQVVIPADTPPGSYQLNVGWYDSATLQRLDAFDGAGTSWGNSVGLQTIEITAP
jgi:hypothetical protein